MTESRLRIRRRKVIILRVRRGAVRVPIGAAFEAEAEAGLAGLVLVYVVVVPSIIESVNATPHSERIFVCMHACLEPSHSLTGHRHTGRVALAKSLLLCNVFFLPSG